MVFFLWMRSKKFEIFWLMMPVRKCFLPRRINTEMFLCTHLFPHPLFFPFPPTFSTPEQDWERRWRWRWGWGKVGKDCVFWANSRAEVCVHGYVVGEIILNRGPSIKDRKESSWHPWNSLPQKSILAYLVHNRDHLGILVTASLLVWRSSGQTTHQATMTLLLWSVMIAITISLEPLPKQRWDDYPLGHTCDQDCLIITCISLQCPQIIVYWNLKPMSVLWRWLKLKCYLPVAAQTM
jgi:hypothetical protein